MHLVSWAGTGKVASACKIGACHCPVQAFQPSPFGWQPSILALSVLVLPSEGQMS